MAARLALLALSVALWWACGEGPRAKPEVPESVSPGWRAPSPRCPARRRRYRRGDRRVGWQAKFTAAAARTDLALPVQRHHGRIRCRAARARRSPDREISGRRVSGAGETEQCAHGPTLPSRSAPFRFGRALLPVLDAGLIVSGYFAWWFGLLDRPTLILTFSGLLVRAASLAGLRAHRDPSGMSSLLALAYMAFFPIDFYLISRDFLTTTVHAVCFWPPSNLTAR